MLAAGTQAPSFTLPGIDGQDHSLADALQKGPVLAAFYKISCPVCQFTFPFIERIHQAYGNSKLTIWGISQDDARDTKDFSKEYGVNFLSLTDGGAYAVSNAYGITNVPSLFLISQDGKVRFSSSGFSKKDLESVAADFAAASGRPLAAVFKPGEIVPDSKPG